MHSELTLPEHDKAITKFNRLMIKFKLHLSGIELMTEAEIEQMDEIANEIRADIEKCQKPIRIRR